MLSKTLLSNEKWIVSIGLLGMGSISVSDHHGETYTATSAEKAFILDTLVALDRKNLPLEVFLPVRYNILSGFAAGIFEQRRGSAWPLTYQIVFGEAPGSQVDSYIRAYHNTVSM